MKDRPDAILRAVAAGWELWKFSPKTPPLKVVDPEPKDCQGATVLLALPTCDTLVVPVWTSPEADVEEVVTLELSSRHLLRRGSVVQPMRLEAANDRALVLGIGVSDDAVASQFFASASRFEISARCWSAADADLLVWRELGRLAFALVDAQAQVVLASASGETEVGAPFCAAVKRAAFRLQCESVITHLPARARLLGEFSDAEITLLRERLGVAVDHVSELPPPLLPGVISDPAPPVSRAARIRQQTLKKWGFVGLIALGVYALAVALLVGDLVRLRWALQKAEERWEEVRSASEQAQRDVTEWDLFRNAVDPRAFALDQLAAAAQALPGDQVRLIQFQLESGRLLISGEAADVSQAFTFFEKIKASSTLSEYDWSPRQPQLAGKNKVRFEIEGVRPDAQTSEE